MRRKLVFHPNNNEFPSVSCDLISQELVQQFWYNFAWCLGMYWGKGCAKFQKIPFTNKNFSLIAQFSLWKMGRVAAFFGELLKFVKKAYIVEILFRSYIVPSYSKRCSDHWRSCWAWGCNVQNVRDRRDLWCGEKTCLGRHFRNKMELDFCYWTRNCEWQLIHKLNW